MNSLKPQVVQLYKNLYFMGKDYPKGSKFFRAKLKSTFRKNKNVSDINDIKKLLARGEYIVKELEALYMLKKYRAIKQLYYDNE